MNQPAIAYTRVNTAQQGFSGVGLKDRQVAIARFVEANGFEIVGEFVDIATSESPQNSDKCSGLSAALEEARTLRVPIIVATLDCLCVDAEFISGLVARKITFFVAEPGVEVDPSLLHMYVALGRIQRAMKWAPVDLAATAQREEFA